jgi:small subunit ribosomal protein S7
MTTKKSDLIGLDFFPAIAKYNINDIKIVDKGLEKYINIDTKNIYMGGVFSNKMFGKSKIPIIERLINNLMRSEVFNGKKSKAYKVVRDAMDIIDKKLKTNPLQVLIDAIQNSAPIEETTRLQFGGISVPKAVDISPQRRLDIAIRNICLGSISATHKNKKGIENCLADELMKAAKNDATSFAVAKRNDAERIAKSAR